MGRYQTMFKRVVEQFLWRSGEETITQDMWKNKGRGRREKNGEKKENTREYEDLKKDSILGKSEAGMKVNIKWGRENGRKEGREAVRRKRRR